MKDSGLSNWPTKCLEDVTTLITCGVAARPTYVAKGIPFLSAKNIKDGQIIWSDYKYISEETHLALTKHNKPCVGDVLYTRVGSFGEAAVIEKDADFSLFVSLTLIKPNRELLDPNFLKYYLNSPIVKKVAKESISSSGVGNLNVGKVRKFKINLPSLEEQRRIVSILDEVFKEVDRVKEIAEMNHKSTQDLFESTLSHYLNDRGKDWEHRTLKDISLVFGRGRSRHRPRNDKELYGGKYPFIQTGDIRNANQLITKYTQTYNEQGLAQSKLWPKGTICITIAANIAETGILGFDACFPDSVIGLIVDPKKAIPEFVEYTLQSYKKRLQAKGKGSAQDNLNMEKFENEFFPIPTLKTQQNILSELKAIASETQQLNALYVEKVAQAMELRKSVLNKAFRGEL